MFKSITDTRRLLDRIKMSIFGKEFSIRCEVDNIYEDGRIFVQVVYKADCVKTGVEQEWHGRKLYLSGYMTDDEVVKTCYAAFEAVVRHEIMEGFTVDGIVLFNPHVNFEELLKISGKEVKRENNAV
jgi:hypothetical protein